MPSDPAIARFVEKQMRNWELSRAQASAAPRSVEPAVEDFVCVSYAWGSGGEEIARRLAERLGWPMFDRELLEAMAAGEDFRRRLYESLDERDLHWFEEYLRAFFEVDFNRNDYFPRLTTTVLALARKGHAVFLGRAGDLILPRDLGFRVKIIAPRSYCVAHYAKQHGCDESTAARRIDQLERERHDFIQRHFGRDADDPSRYDLMLNAASFPREAAVDVVLTARTARRER